MEDTPNGQPYGPHLTIDAYGCEKERLASLDVVFDFLDRMPDVIGMQKITKPYVFKHLAEPDPEWGITGVVIIATSHCSIHTYPQRGVAFVDVFSCKAFDTGKAQEFFQEVFKAKRMDASEVKRGIHFHEIIGGEW
jgi:S-adenosylmethionine decarboxylase